MRIIFFGCTTFSEQLLNSIIKINNIEIVAIFTIPQEFTISYSVKPVVNSNFSDLAPYAKQLNIPIYEIDSVEGKKTIDYETTILDLNADVILVLGWYYMVPKRIRETVRFGAWGIHASLLPCYAGGAPLVWAIIEGQKETGVTLFRFDNGVDDGDIIAQQKFEIAENETIKEVYEKATIASKEILENVFTSNKEINFIKQDKSKIKVYPQRSPADGKIDWTWDDVRIKNFIRAQTKPYPGAWTEINGKKVIIWDAEILNL